MQAKGIEYMPPLAVIDHEMVVSLFWAAVNTALTLSPLALVVIILLVPYVYRILFLRARVDKRAYRQTRSRTAPIVRKMRKRLDFDARHWETYISDQRRNLKFRVEVSFLYDVAKAAAAYYRSGEWEDYMRQHGVVQPAFIDEEHPLSENLERNGFFLSQFFAEGVANRYLMRRTASGYASVEVQTDETLLGRAMVLFKEGLQEVEEQYEEGHIYLPFLKLSRWERIRFRIHTMIITKMLSDGMQKGLALVLSYGLVHTLRGENVSQGTVGFIMDIVALLFMTHVFDSLFTRRYSQYKVDWEDRERFFYRRQIHQYIIGLDPEAARAQRAAEKDGIRLSGERTGDPRGVRRIFKTLKRASRHPQETGRLLGAAQDVLDYSREEALPIVLVLVKELAAFYPEAYEKLMERWRRRAHPWRVSDDLVRILLNERAYDAIASEKGRLLPARANKYERQRAVNALQNEFPDEIDKAKTELLLEDLSTSNLTPKDRQAIILTHFLGGLLWRLRLIDAADPLMRRKDARLYHSTLAYTIPGLVYLHTRQKERLCDYGMESHEISSLITRITDTLPLAAGHRLRLKMANQPEIAAAVEEIQEMLRIKQSPATSTAPDLGKGHLVAWLETGSGDQESLAVLSRAVHEAYRSGLTSRMDTWAQVGSGRLTIDPRVFDPQFNPHGAKNLQQRLAKTGIDNEANEAVRVFLGFLGADGCKPEALGKAPVRLTFLDLQPVVDYVLDQERDAEILEEMTHQALVEFYQAARMAKSVHDLPDALIRPSEGEDSGGTIAQQMAVARTLKARVSTAQEPVFLLLQESVHQLDVIVNPAHASMEHLLGQASRLNEDVEETTRTGLYRLQDAGRALLLPLTCMAERRGIFQESLDSYWSVFEPATDKEKFLRQFDVQGEEHGEAIIRARILLQQYEALRALAPTYPGERTAYASFDTMSGDAALLRISAAVVITMIDQSGLRSRKQLAAVRKVLEEAMTRQGFCKRGNLSDLVRVTLKERDAFGHTVIMRRARPFNANRDQTEIWKREPHGQSSQTMQ